MRKLFVALSLILLALSGCVYVPSGLGINAGEPPSIASFEASPDAISAGSRAQLSWTVTGARSVIIDNGVGSVALRGSRTVIPAVTTTYTMTATNASGSVNATAVVTVSGTTSGTGGAPLIVSFTASPSSVTAGGASVLAWNISKGTGAVIDQGIGGVDAAAGTRVVTPGVTTTYSLTASNSSGSVTSAVTVFVSGSPGGYGLPVVNMFEANPSNIALGGSTALSWNVSNSSQVTIQSSGGSFLVVNPVGSIVSTPAASSTYTLTASNSTGVASRTVSVTVGGGADTTPPTIPSLISPAEGATLPQPGSSWNFDWADSGDPENGIQKYEIYVIRTGAGSPAIDDYSLNSSYSKILGGSIDAAFLTNWTWKVRAQNNIGLWSDWSTVRTFNVEPAPAVAHTVNLTSVAGETGAVYSDGTVSTGTRFVGDTGGNAGIRCYFSYDISGLAGKNVTSAKLTLPVNSIVRDPFGHLSGLWVAKINYGTGALQASDYNLAGTPFAASFPTVPAELDITSYVKNAVLAVDPRFQTRLHFATQTNNDNLADYVNLGNAVLTITYTD